MNSPPGYSPSEETQSLHISSKAVDFGPLKDEVASQTIVISNLNAEGTHPIIWKILTNVHHYGATPNMGVLQPGTSTVVDLTRQSLSAMQKRPEKHARTPKFLIKSTPFLPDWKLSEDDPLGGTWKAIEKLTNANLHEQRIVCKKAKGTPSTRGVRTELPRLQEESVRLNELLATPFQSTSANGGLAGEGFEVAPPYSEAASSSSTDEVD